MGRRQHGCLFTELHAILGQGDPMIGIRGKVRGLVLFVGPQIWAPGFPLCIEVRCVMVGLVGWSGRLHVAASPVTPRPVPPFHLKLCVFFLLFTRPIRLHPRHGARDVEHSCGHTLAFPLPKRPGTAFASRSTGVFSCVQSSLSPFTRLHLRRNAASVNGSLRSCASWRARQGGGIDTNEAVRPFPTDPDASQDRPDRKGWLRKDRRCSDERKRPSKPLPSENPYQNRPPCATEVGSGMRGKTKELGGTQKTCAQRIGLPRCRTVSPWIGDGRGAWSLC